MNDEITKAIRMSTVNSLENRYTILATDAPKVFRIPTSLVRCKVIKEIKPYKPRHEMNIANPANIFANCDC